MGPINVPFDGENDRADEQFSRENSTGSPIISKHGYRSATDAQVFPGCCNRSLLLISRSSIFLYVSSCKLRLEEDNTSLNMETSSKLCFFFLKLVFRCLPWGISSISHGISQLSDPWHFPSKWCVKSPENSVISRPSILRHHASAPDREISGSTPKKTLPFFLLLGFSQPRVIHSYP